MRQAIHYLAIVVGLPSPITPPCKQYNKKAVKYKLKSTCHWREDDLADDLSNNNTTDNIDSLHFVSLG